MQAEHFYLTSIDVVKAVNARLLDFDLDGKVKVTFSDAGTKSSKQRGLDWKWNGEIAAHYKSTGTGGEHDDTKEGVHLVCKWRFGVRILQRDDDFFNDLYAAWRKKYEGNKRAIMWFIDKHVSTEDFTVSQQAEYMTEKQRYYLGKGVNLTDPEFRGLLEA